MTDEQIIELVEKHFDFISEYTASGWITDTEGLLKFARIIYERGYDDCDDENAMENAGEDL